MTTTLTRQRTTTTPIDRVTGTAMIAGPLLLFGAGIAWLADVAEARAILLFWAMVGFAGVFVGLSRRLSTTAPAAAAIVLALGLIGVAGGIGYALEVAMVDAFGIERLNDQELASTFLMLRLPGLTFPLTLIASGVLCWRNGLLPTFHALALGLGGLAFPLSRIPESPGLGLVADLLLVVALVPIGWETLRGGAGHGSGSGVG